MQIKIVAFCGSSRRDSLNQKLLDIVVLGALDAGAQVSNIRLRDFPLPIYDGDWETEHGLPERARALKALIAEHHALLIATPEHNGGYTALLKNALDWASRPVESDPTGLEVFAGKAAAMVSASPGVLGGMRAQIALQISLNKLGLLVIPNSFALGLAHQAFNEKWLLKDANADKSVRGLGAALVTTASTLAPKSKPIAAEKTGAPAPAPKIVGAPAIDDPALFQVEPIAYGYELKTEWRRIGKAKTATR